MVRQGDTTFQAAAVKSPKPYVGATGWTATATGTFAITGLGFKPSVVIFFSANPSSGNGAFSVGLDDGTTHNTIQRANGDLNYSHADDRSIQMDYNATGSRGVISSLDTDGFTITRNVTGSPPAGTVYVNYLAFQ